MVDVRETQLLDISVSEEPAKSVFVLGRYPLKRQETLRPPP